MPKTRATRKPLPRCNHGVCVLTEEQVEPCGEPAVAVWTWPDGGSLYVCDEHDEAVRQAEADAEAANPDKET